MGSWPCPAASRAQVQQHADTSLLRIELAQVSNITRSAQCCVHPRSYTAAAELAVCGSACTACRSPQISQCENPQPRLLGLLTLVQISLHRVQLAPVQPVLCAPSLSHLLSATALVQQSVSVCFCTVSPCLMKFSVV